MKINNKNLYTQKTYNKEFGINKSSNDKHDSALRNALDIRKFEIELYWKRASYFWTFIAAALAAYGMIQASSNIDNDVKSDLSVYLCCLGIIFSFGWYCVNRGSKRWQENWENHVDLLEDDINGPLYKVVLSREKPKTMHGKIRVILTGPADWSVSKINLLISIYVTLFWVFLLARELLPFDSGLSINWQYVISVVLTLGFCVLFVTLGASQDQPYNHVATKRATRIISKY